MLGFSKAGTIMEERQKFLVILDREPEGGYAVYCPALPGCCSQGENRDEALGMIQDAIIGVLEVIEEERRGGFPEGESLPLAETPELVARQISEALAFRLAEGDPIGMELVPVEVSVPVAV